MNYYALKALFKRLDSPTAARLRATSRDLAYIGRTVPITQRNLHEPKDHKEFIRAAIRMGCKMTRGNIRLRGPAPRTYLTKMRSLGLHPKGKLFYIEASPFFVTADGFLNQQLGRPLALAPRRSRTVYGHFGSSLVQLKVSLSDSGIVSHSVKSLNTKAPYRLLFTTDTDGKLVFVGNVVDKLWHPGGNYNWGNLMSGHRAIEDVKRYLRSLAGKPVCSPRYVDA